MGAAEGAAHLLGVVADVVAALLGVVRLLARSLLADRQHGPLPALLLALTFVTGMVDATSVLTLDKVFVSNMTGNTVFIGFALAGAKGFDLIHLVPAVVGFLVGAFIAGGVDYRLRRFRHVVLSYVTGVQAALFTLAAVVAGASGLPPRTVATVSVIVVLAVAMGLQNAMARRLAVPDLLTSLATMTLVSLVADIRRQDSATVTRRVASLTCIALGAFVGGAVVIRVGVVASLAVVILVLIGVSLTARAVGRVGEGDWQRRRDQSPSPEH